MSAIIGDGGGLLDVLRHLVLPAVATARGPGGHHHPHRALQHAGVAETRTMSASRAPRACRGARILWRHVLRNALPPIATITGLQLGYLLGGALLTEVVFAWPGLGYQLYLLDHRARLPVVQAASC